MHMDYDALRRDLDEIECWSSQTVSQAQLNKLVTLRSAIRQYDLVSARWLAHYYSKQGRYKTISFKFVLNQVDNECHDFNNEEEMLLLYTMARDYHHYTCNIDVLRIGDSEPEKFQER